MSTYGGRRGPNVSQYLRELNTLPARSTHDTSSAADEAYAVEDDLAMFTNTQFFDFDSGQNTDYNAPATLKPDPSDGSRRSEDATSAASVMDDFSSLDFVTGDFGLGEFGSAYASPTIASFNDPLGSLTASVQGNNHQQHQHHHQHHQQTPSVAGYPPLAPLHQQSPHLQGDAFSTTAAHHAQGAPSVSGSDTPIPGSSRQSVVAIGGAGGMEEVARVAAEEDKRRRNTAASARFRVKKKQREQALEKSAKEMTDKVTKLEGRIAQLETENKWLKNLIMEKNNEPSGSGNSEDVAKLLSAGGSKGGSSSTTTKGATSSRAESSSSRASSSSSDAASRSSKE